MLELPFPLPEQLQQAPWIPFKFSDYELQNDALFADPDSDESSVYKPHTLFIKAHFSERHYTLLISDFHRVWFEHLDDLSTRDKLRSTAKGFKEDSLENLLRKVRSMVHKQQKEVTYKVSWQPDETGDLYLHTDGVISSGPNFIPLRWIFKCKQLHSFSKNVIDSLIRSAEQTMNPFSPPPGQVLQHSLTTPLFALCVEYQKQIEILKTMVEKKDFEIKNYLDILQFNGIKKLPTRKTIEFNRERFREENELFLKENLSQNSFVESLATSLLRNPENQNLYLLITSVLSNTKVIEPSEEVSDEIQFASQAEVTGSSLLKIPSLDMAVGTGGYQTLGTLENNQKQQTLSTESVETKVEKDRKRKEMNERIERLREEKSDQKPKKKKKLI
ncbi:hypothetical protein HK096_004214 [Nowakowskiella sp. JEL0078]|nr:hypothetical protein HK096_004214 [Nowakowskiella sp. JEL0078]